MEQQPPTVSRRHDEPEFNLKEWSLRARVSRENTSSRRFSASYIRNLGDDGRSFRSNITISSTASSPGYAIREIDPSTYSFTNALRALQAKTVYSWEYMSPEGLALNSKWSEAERYICNPLSGEVPLECLSSKALSGRSFRQLSSKFTMSAPLIYPAQPRLHFQMKPPVITLEDDHVKTTIKEKRIGSTRDVGIQSICDAAISSKSPSPARTPPIEERSIKRIGTETSEDSPLSAEKLKFKEEVEMKETRNKVEEEQDDRRKNREEKKKTKKKWRCSMEGQGCLSWRNLWTKGKKNKQSRNNNNNSSRLVGHMKSCKGKKIDSCFQLARPPKKEKKRTRFELNWVSL